MKVRMPSPSPVRAADLVQLADRARICRVRRAILRWAPTAGRNFFWRKRGVSPFALLVTEVLLSRTRAEVVEPVAIQLLSRFPRPIDLARAEISEVEHLLYSLGLYRKRSKRLVACARELVTNFSGQVPRRPEELMALPYVGRYTANAVGCFAFGEARAVIDANVSRVYQRIFSLPRPPARLSSANALWQFAQVVLPRSATATKEFNWAILDLGGTVCTPKKPSCTICPVAFTCDAHRSGTCGCSGEPGLCRRGRRSNKRTLKS
jgi:A/G-specific adenine glycosylase